MEAYLLGALWELISECFQNCSASAYIIILFMQSISLRRALLSQKPGFLCGTRKKDVLEAVDRLLATIQEP